MQPALKVDVTKFQQIVLYPSNLFCVFCVDLHVLRVDYKSLSIRVLFYVLAQRYCWSCVSSVARSTLHYDDLFCSCLYVEVT